MIPPARWIWAIFAAFFDLLKTFGLLLTTRWAIAFALLIIAIFVAQVAPR